MRSSVYLVILPSIPLLSFFALLPSPSLYLSTCACAHPCTQCVHSCVHVRVGVLVSRGRRMCLPFLHCPGLFLSPIPTSMPLTNNVFKGPALFLPHSLFPFGLLGQGSGKEHRLHIIQWRQNLRLLLPLPCTPGDRGPEKHSPGVR